MAPGVPPRPTGIGWATPAGRPRRPHRAGRGVFRGCDTHPEPGFLFSSSRATPRARCTTFRGRPRRRVPGRGAAVAGVEYSVTHHGDRFFMATNRGAENFRVLEAPAANPSRETGGGTPIPSRRENRRLRRVPRPSGRLRARSGARQIRVSISPSAKSTASPSPSRCTPCTARRIRRSTPPCSASSTPRS